MKEALFSSIAADIPGARVLDLYAGSGSLGLEALSRGAASATFVEQDRAALQALADNLAATQMDGTIVSGDVDSYLGRTGEEFDVIFVDPPYRLSLALVTEVLGGAAACLANGGLIMVHRQVGEDAPEAPAGTVRTDDRRYGGAQLWIYRKEAS